MVVLAISCPMLGLYLRLAPNIVVNGKAIDVRHHCIFWMHILIILVLDVYTIGGFIVMRLMITVVYASRAWVCASWLMSCRMTVWMLCSIIYSYASGLH